MPSPLTIGIVNDHELVVRGITSMLAGRDDIRVVEIVTSAPLETSVDIALYDHSTMDPDGADLDALTSEPRIGHLVLYTWHLTPEAVEEAFARGTAGVLSKALPTLELVHALHEIRAGGRVVRPEPPPTRSALPGDWPGRDQGLTARESEVIALITQGLSNADIAARTHLSINSVKSYIRTAYRTMGVGSRSQAVLWGIDHGFGHDRVRVATARPL